MAGALVVNADDLGVSRGATLGVVRAHREGIVTSASLATTTPFYSHAVELCARTCPDLGLGLHFTLTAGKPVSPARQVPLLVDERGFFRQRFLSLLRGTAVARHGVLLDQIELELEAQLERMIGDGLRPDHIDGERHVHLIPGIFERVISAARRHGIGFVRAGRDIGVRFLSPADVLRLVVSGGFVKFALLSCLARRGRKLLGKETGSASRFASFLYSGRLDLLLRDVLMASPPASSPGAAAGEITEIMVHPGVPEESRDVDLGNPELARYLASEDRRREMEACIRAREWAAGWRLTTFGQLAAERTPARPAEVSRR